MLFNLFSLWCMHAVYTFTSTKIECTVQVEVKGGGGLLCNIAAMLLKVLQIQSSVGERGIYQCGNLLQTQ